MKTKRNADTYILGRAEFTALTAKGKIVPGAIYIIEDESNKVIVGTTKVASFTTVAAATVVTDLTKTATTGSLPTANGSVTISDAATPTVTELLEFCVELAAKQKAITDALKAASLMASS